MAAKDPNENVDEKLVLTPRAAAKAIDAALDLNHPLMLWGAPGIGKSQLVQQAAAMRNGWGIIDVRAATYGPEDVRGIPYVVGDECRQAFPSILPRPGRDPEHGILFLDELPQAPPATQGALLQLVLDRAIDTYKLLPGWRIIAAGNDREHHAGGFKLLSALSRRFINLNLITDPEQWRDWAMAHGVSPIVVAFLRFRPALLNDDDLRKKVGPNPRAWVMASEMIESGRMTKDIELPMLSGVLDKGPAGELLTFVQVYRNLPDPDEVIANPTKVPVPTDLATKYAICGALSSRVTVQNVAAIFTYACRMTEEFTALLVTDCVRYNNDITSTRTFSDFVSKHGDKFLAGRG
jgi:hypothetical protein